MDRFYSCSSVCDTRVSLITRPTSISLHSISLTTPDFHFAFVRNPPTIVIPSKLSWRISCEAIPTKQSHLNPQIEEERRRRHNAMEDFLLQECCFTSSEIILLIRKYPSLFGRKSIDRARRVVQMFKDCGFTVEQVKRTVLTRPDILIRSADDNMKPAVEYLRTLGIAEEDMKHIIYNNPRILSLSWDKSLAPRILALIKFFGSKDSLLRALKKSPGLASCDVELLNDKVKALENAGLLEHDIKKILEKDPRFLCASVGKIEKNMEFLRCTLGLEPIVLVTYPVLLSYSVEKRMRPRYKVFQYLNSVPGRHDLTIGLITSMIISEKIFTERFLSGSPEAKMLYEKYKSKTVDVEEPELLTTRQR